MKRQNPVFYSNKPERKIYVDYSPKMQAKKFEVIKANKFDLKAQASAYMRHRNPQMKAHRMQSPPQYHEKRTLKKLNQQRHILNQDQIRNSALYRMLEQEIKQLTKRQQEQLGKTRKMKENKKKQLESANKEQYGVQLQIWELRNQVTDLKDSIDEEKRQTERLNQELGINQEEQEQELQDEQEQQGQQQGQQQEEGEDKKQQQKQLAQPANQQPLPTFNADKSDDNQRESNSQDDSSS